MRKSRALLLLAGVAALLSIPATALAYAPTGANFIACVVSNQNARIVFCEAGVFDPGTAADTQAEYNPVFYTDTVTTDDEGIASFEFVVPEAAEDAEIDVTVNGTFNGQPLVLAETVALVEEDGTIVATGANSLGLVAIAVAALALGSGILAVSRRNRGADA